MNGPAIESESWSDMRIYLLISRAIDAGVWEESHFFQSIGYPLLITGIKYFTTEFGRLLIYLQSIASILTIAFLYLMTRNTLGRRVALISLVIGSVHMPWFLFTNFALPEVFFTLLLSLCGYLSTKIIYRRRPSILICASWAVCFILAFWLKGTHALWGPLFLLGLFAHKRKFAWKPVLVICSVVALGLLGHAFFTYQTIGKIQFGPSTSGLNFVEGKCPSKVNLDSAGYHWQSPLYYQLEMNRTKKWNRPFTNSSYFLKEGLKCIKNDPWVLVQSLESIPFLFYGNTIWPFNRKPFSHYTRLYELFFAFFAIVGLSFYYFKVFTLRRPEEVIMWTLPVLAIFLCVYIFKSEMRYRIPFDLWFIPLAVKGWIELTAYQKAPEAE